MAPEHTRAAYSPWLEPVRSLGGAWRFDGPVGLLRGRGQVILYEEGDLAGTDEIKSVAVWSPGHRYWAVRPDRAELDVFRGFAKQVAGEIVASAWPAGGGEIGIALVLLRSEGRRRAVDIQCRLGRIDNRLLHVELGLLAGDRGFRGGDIRPRLIERDLVVAVVNSRQHLAAMHALVIASQYFAQIAGDLWRNGGVVGLHVSVIGRDQETADGPIIPAVPGCAGKHRDGGCRHQKPLEADLFGGFYRRSGGFGRR